MKERIGFEGCGGGLAGDVGEQARDDVLQEGLLKSGVDGLGDAEEGLAIECVDPVVGGGAQAEFFTADIAPRQFGEGAVINAGVAVDEEHAGGLNVVGHPVAGELAAPTGGALVVAEEGDFRPQGLDFGNAVKAQQFSSSPRAAATRSMDRVVAMPIGATPSATLRALWVVGAAAGGARSVRTAAEMSFF